MSDLILPDSRLETPELFYPGRKPVGNVKLLHSHPIVQKANDILLLNDGNIPPLNLINNKKWEVDTINGSQDYAYQSVNGNISLKRQDLDESGIVYKNEATTINTDNNPYFTMCIYTILAAPSAAHVSLLSRGDTSRDGLPVWFYTSESTSTLKFWFKNDYRWTGIPVNVGKKHIFLHRYDGSFNSIFYDSARGVWESFAGVSLNDTASDRTWLGGGFDNELPCAFELFIAGIGQVPSIPECHKIVKDPYSFLVPA